MLGHLSILSISVFDENLPAFSERFTMYPLGTGTASLSRDLPFARAISAYEAVST
jgi:hypothetical protein